MVGIPDIYNTVEIRMKPLSLHNIGKMYRIGHRGPGTRAEAYHTLREDVTRGVIDIGKKIIYGSSYITSSIEDFWALRGVTFDVDEGEVLGIIGKNGAGKSTLLKILSRVTIPTEGYADINGSFGSLLEVGIGFHPELTGRENIYIYGAILGLKSKYIEENIDNIITFAEIEQFIDMPVKRFSTGMWTRLAFSVAATMDPDIMMIDEALSVGDTKFQKKAFSRMREISRDGRTVLMVSHNMDSIKDFCDRVLWLENGKVKRIGEPEDIINEYSA
jgi:lipopolysaccharide transport system ATP-binding protein